MCHGSKVSLYVENGHCTFHDGNLIIGISNSIKLPCKTNMSPESQWLEDVFPIEITHFQRTCVSFRRVYWVNEPIPISSITVTVVGELLHSTTESLPIPWIIWGSYSWGRFLPSLRKPWDLIHPFSPLKDPQTAPDLNLCFWNLISCSSSQNLMQKQIPQEISLQNGPVISCKWDYNPYKWPKINGFSWG